MRYTDPGPKMLEEREVYFPCVFRLIKEKSFGRKGSLLFSSIRDIRSWKRDTLFYSSGRAVRCFCSLHRKMMEEVIQRRVVFRMS